VTGARYRFGDSVARGMLGRIRLGQAVGVVAGAAWGVVVLNAAPSAGGAIAALGSLMVATGAVTVPVAGRTLEQWAPVAAGWLLTRVSPPWLTRAREPAGTVVGLVSESNGGVTTTVRRPGRVAPPAGCGAIRLVEIPYRGRKVGAISERAGRRLTLLLVGRAPGFALADEGEQQQRLAVWGEVLKGACRGAVRRIQWVERTAPAQGDGLARWLHGQRDPTIALDGALGRSYLELIHTSAQAGREHEVMLAVQIDAALMRSDERHRRHETLIAAAEQVSRGLARARVQLDAALTVGGLARVLRTGFDPYVHRQLAALRTAGGSDELSQAAAWPAATRETWAHYVTDAAVHATYEIGGWPRAEVGPAFLGGLLAPSEHVRAVAVCFEPLDPLRSLRDAEYEITREETDRQTRARFGQVETSRQRQSTDAARQREIELASGHAEVRLAGFVTVTAPDPVALDAASEELVNHAGRANLELRRLYGQQAEAFTFTLPLCRGLR
jgi:hypothetical protein